MDKILEGIVTAEHRWGTVGKRALISKSLKSASQQIQGKQIEGLFQFWISEFLLKILIFFKRSGIKCSKVGLAFHIKGVVEDYGISAKTCLVSICWWSEKPCQRAKVCEKTLKYYFIQWSREENLSVSLGMFLFWHLSWVLSFFILNFLLLH